MDRRSSRAPGAVGAVLVASACLAWSGSAAQDAGPSDSQPASPESGPLRTYREVKRFDFDERRLGNYEPVPMYWTPLRGPGLPAYSRGQFDESVGHAAPPSFRLDLQGGNVAYAYQAPDLTIEPRFDYMVAAHVRVAGLVHSRAFVAAAFVDARGERIAGSQQVSELVGGPDADPDQWRRVTLLLRGDFADAAAVRLELWIAQRHIWADPDEAEPDAIVRQDVGGRAWFDDVAVYRMARARFGLSDPGGLVRPGRAERFVLELHNFSPQPLDADLRVENESGQSLHAARLEIAPWLDRAIESPVPPLPPGTYRARVDVRSDGTPLLTRAIRFCVLSDAVGGAGRSPEFGFDLGRWRGGDVEGLLSLLTESGCGAVRIGVPAVGGLTSAETIRYFEEMADLLRRLPTHRLEAVGVILSRQAAVEPQAGESTRALAESDERWRSLVNPVLAHLGGLLNAWQLGEERGELADGQGWRPEQVARVHDHLRRFVTYPRIITPVGPGLESAPATDARSVLVPASVPARELPRHLEALVRTRDRPVWVRLEAETSDSIAPADRIADLGRRIILTRALHPERIILDAPFELSTSGGELSWQPSACYPVVRTLVDRLARLRAVAVLQSDDLVSAIIFEGADAGCVFAWSWTDGLRPVEVEYYLGPEPRLCDLLGRRRPLEVRDGRARVPLGPEPVIIENISVTLAQLQASFRVEPTYLQAHAAEPRPVLSFRNHSTARLAGSVALAPPANWTVEPQTFDFSLGTGEGIEQALLVRTPPRELAGSYVLGVHFTLHAPEQSRLSFQVPLRLGLADIEVYETLTRVGDDLIVQQTVKNLTGESVSFWGFCQAPNRPRQEVVFHRVPPGEMARQRFVYGRADELAGRRLHMGLREIHGLRSLDKLVDVP